jgi:hypothetical protein
VFGSVFVPGPREVTEALWNTCCAAVVATGLTGSVHQSDRRRPSVWPCSTGSKPCKFPLFVLVCFGSVGCLLVPRSSSTPVAAWAWPTWVVSRRRVLEAVFVLLESPSPYRRIFIGSHSLPPLWFAVSVLQLESDMVVNSLSPATLHLQISSRPVRISPAPSHRLQPSQRVVLHLDASFFDASAAPTD